MNEANIEEINQRLLSLIPKERLSHVFNTGDVDPEFLGFVEQYDAMARLIPKHYTIVDLGCAYAPQAYLFADHAAYFGVDATTEERDTFIDRSALPNAKFFHTDIATFIDLTADTFNHETTFAICSYVPPWYGEVRRLVGATFLNVFNYYPAGLKHPTIKKPS